MRALRFLTLLPIAAVAAVGQPALENRYSQSGQFIVSGRVLPAAAARVVHFDEATRRFVAGGWTPGERPAPQAGGGTNTVTLRLDPNYLVATAERVRQVINDALQLNEPYRGKVFINLLEAASPNDPIVVQSHADPGRGAPYYKIALPAELAPERLLRVLTEVLLREAANREPGLGGGEIPLWLNEGLFAHLEARAAEAAFFDPNQGVNVLYQPTDEMKYLSETIHPGSCLTLEQLSWPGMLESGPETERMFRLSAHALVVELLRLRDGGRCLGRMVRQLPRFENWQFAFLTGFQQHFPSLLDAEKWWAVTSLHLGDRGAFEHWTFAESLERLDRALVLRVERRTEPDAEMIREEIDLPTLLVTVGFEKQKVMLARIISGLFNLELRAAPQVGRLVKDYRAALEKYVTDREDALRQDAERLRPGRLQEFALEVALKQLERLAAIRRDFDLLLPGDPVPAPVARLSAVTP